MFCLRIHSLELKPSEITTFNITISKCLSLYYKGTDVSENYFATKNLSRNGPNVVT